MLSKKPKKYAAKRKEFLRSKEKNASKTDKVTESGAAESNSVMNIHDRKGGRSRKARRG